MKNALRIAAFGTAALVSAVAQAQDFRARDVQGIELNMTSAEVERVTHVRLMSLGRGDCQAKVNGTIFDLGFTPMGHLHRIDSDRPLGVFEPDQKFAAELTGKLVAKFGTPQSNGLPLGPIDWGRTEAATSSYGTYSFEIETLTAMLEGGSGQPIRLKMHRIDFRLL